MTDKLDTVEIILSESDIRQSIIWLHGLGADGNDFAPMVPELKKYGITATRFVFPNARVRPITINGGMQMRGWYDIANLDFDPTDDDEAGIRESQKLLELLIERENRRGISSEQIYLAGFSQGGAIALQTALRYPEPLAGLIALSTYLPLASRLADESSDANKSLRIFMAHGQHDDVIPIRVAEQSRQHLLGQGYTIDWKTYPVAHSLSVDEIVEIASWLNASEN